MTYTLSELHTDAASGLSWRTRLPMPAKAARCVILLHGVGSNETHLLDLSTGMEADTLVIFARGPLQLGVNQHAWFRVAFTPDGPRIVAEEAERSRLQLIRFTESMQALHGLAASATVMAGFSQGGIMSASLALSAPQRVAGFAILSGRILPELAPHLADRQQLAALQAFIGHGEHDSTLPVSWALRSDQWLSELGVPHQLRLYPVDHSISPAMRADFLDWLRASCRPVAPLGQHPA